jgi:ribonuclease HI
LGFHLARQIAITHSIDPAEGVEPITETRPEPFPGRVYIQDSEAAMKTAKDISTQGLALWSDGSRLQHGGTGCGVAWKTNGVWQTTKTNLGRNKEIFDAELLGVSDALGVALKVAAQNEAITVFLDSQVAIQRIRSSTTQAGQAITGQIHKRARQLQQRGNKVTIRWVPGHLGIDGNERADKSAKEAANSAGRKTAQWSSLAHIRRVITEGSAMEAEEWLQVRLRRLEAKARTMCHSAERASIRL